MRHHPRFSLRTLFVLVAFVSALAALLGWIARERQQSMREQEIAETLKANGCTVTFDQQLSQKLLGRRVDSVAYRSGPTTFNLLAELKSMTWLYAGDSQVADLAPLAGRTRLQSLNLAGTSVEDVSPLAGLTNLEWLCLDHTKVRDITALTGLKKLRVLLLRDTSVTTENVRLLQQSLPKTFIVAD